MPYTLLLADDSATIQRVIELTFADEDVTVIAVSNGDEAIARLEASPPDIVLADIGMPGRNGYDVAQYIRQSPQLSHIPVVLLTGAFEPVDQARADAAGCDGVLAKPFEPQLVIGRVKELLARPRREPDAPAPERAPAVAERDDYFDRLDAAFSTLSSNQSGQAGATLGAIPDAAPALTDLDWFGGKAGETSAVEPWDDLPVAAGDNQPAPDLPLSYAPARPESSFDPPDTLAPFEPSEAGEVVPAAPDERLVPIEAPPIELEAVPVAPDAAAPVAEVPLPNLPPLPPLADAFAALLAAEQSETLSATSGTWPASPAPSPGMSEDLVEEVARRVLERLSDTVVREAVADVASKVAERLIREEIERIKASIK